MESLTSTIRGSSPADAPVTTDIQARARDIRNQLPGQILAERIETARLEYGPLYSLDEIRTSVAATLPVRFGFTRQAMVEPIDSYRERIPDEALIKYDDARRRQLFSDFSVVSPMYRRETQADPWIIAHVNGTDRYAVITQWT